MNITLHKTFLLNTSDGRTVSNETSTPHPLTKYSVSFFYNAHKVQVLNSFIKDGYLLSQFLRCFSAISNCSVETPGFLLLSFNSPLPPWPSNTIASIIVKLFLQQKLNLSIYLLTRYIYRGTIYRAPSQFH